MSDFDLDAALAALPDPSETINFDYLDRAKARLDASRSPARLPGPPEQPTPRPDGAPGSPPPVTPRAERPAPDVPRPDTAPEVRAPEADPRLEPKFDEGHDVDTPTELSVDQDAADDANAAEDRGAYRSEGRASRVGQLHGHPRGGGANTAAAGTPAPIDDIDDIDAADRGSAAGPGARPDGNTDPDQDTGSEAPQRRSSRRTPATTADTRRRAGGDAPIRAGDLPKEGFSLPGMDGRGLPKVLNMPPDIMTALRTEVAQGLVEHHGLEYDAAMTYANATGQASLIVAFLAAQLDLPLDADARTMLLAAMFRVRSPLLGAILVRLEALEAAEKSTRQTLKQVRDDVTTTAAQVDAAELSATWLVAERAGLDVASDLGGASDDELTERLVGRPANRMRGLVREASRNRRARETHREGRPIR